MLIIHFPNRILRTSSLKVIIVVPPRVRMALTSLTDFITVVLGSIALLRLPPLGYKLLLLFLQLLVTCVFFVFGVRIQIFLYPQRERQLTFVLVQLSFDGLVFLRVVFAQGHCRVVSRLLRVPDRVRLHRLHLSLAAFSLSRQVLNLCNVLWVGIVLSVVIVKDICVCCVYFSF